MIWIELFSTYLHPLIRVLIVKPWIRIAERMNMKPCVSFSVDILTIFFVLTYLPARGLRLFPAADPPYGPTLPVIVLAFAEGRGPVWQSLWRKVTKWRCAGTGTWSPRDRARLLPVCHMKPGLGPVLLALYMSALRQFSLPVLLELILSAAGGEPAERFRPAPLAGPLFEPHLWVPIASLVMWSLERIWHLPLLVYAYPGYDVVFYRGCP
jgi:hypothetical protein